MSDALADVLADAIESWLNKPWLVLPGPVSLAPSLVLHLTEAVAAAGLDVRPTAELEREREQWQDVIDDWADAYMKQARELDALKAKGGQ